MAVFREALFEQVWAEPMPARAAVRPSHDGRGRCPEAPGRGEDCAEANRPRRVRARAFFDLSRRRPSSNGAKHAALPCTPRGDHDEICDHRVGAFSVCNGRPNEQPVSVEQQVIATDEQRMDALRRGDPAPLQRIYADDYTLVTGLGQVRSKADQINDLKRGALRYGHTERRATGAALS